MGLGGSRIECRRGCMGSWRQVEVGQEGWDELVKGPGYSRGIWLCPEGQDEEKREGDSNRIFSWENTISSMKPESRAAKFGGQGKPLGGWKRSRGEMVGHVTRTTALGLEKTR